MNVSPVLFSLTLGDEIIWRYAIPISIDPFIISMKWLSEGILQKSDDIYCIYREGKVYFRYNLSYIKKEGDTFFFDITSKITLEKRELTVNYKRNIYFKFIEEQDIVIYLNKANFFNTTEKSMQEYTSAMLASTDDSNRMLVRFMMGINNKLDALIDLIEVEENKKDLFKAYGIGLNKNYLIIHSAEKIKDDSYAYCELILEGEHRFRFTAVVKFNEYKKSASGWFYKAYFIDTHQATADRIINYLFNKERELIKESKDSDEFN